MTTTIIASEGGAGYFPENTAYAVEKSLEMGADGCELDLHLSADNHFVAHHDYRLNASLCKNKDGNWIADPGPIIKELSLKELKTYNVGEMNPDSRMAKIYSTRKSIEHESIASFSDIESKFTHYTAEFWLEAKNDPYDLVQSTDADTYMTLLGEHIKQSNMNIVLIAFDWNLLGIAKTLLPNIQTGFLSIDHPWLSGKVPEIPLWERQDLNSLKNENKVKWFGDYNPADFDHSFPQAVKAAGGIYWSPYFRDLSKSLVEEAHSLGIKVSTWGANTDEEIEQVLSLGLDSLTTGYAARAQKIRDSL